MFAYKHGNTVQFRICYKLTTRGKRARARGEREKSKKSGRREEKGTKKNENGKSKKRLRRKCYVH